MVSFRSLVSERLWTYYVKLTARPLDTLGLPVTAIRSDLRQDCR